MTCWNKRMPPVSGNAGHVDYEPLDDKKKHENSDAGKTLNGHKCGLASSSASCSIRMINDCNKKNNEPPLNQHNEYPPDRHQHPESKRITVPSAADQEQQMTQSSASLTPESLDSNYSSSQASVVCLGSRNHGNEMLTNGSAEEHSIENHIIILAVIGKRRIITLVSAHLFIVCQWIQSSAWYFECIQQQKTKFELFVALIVSCHEWIIIGFQAIIYFKSICRPNTASPENKPTVTGIAGCQHVFRWLFRWFRP